MYTNTHFPPPFLNSNIMFKKLHKGVRKQTNENGEFMIDNACIVTLWT